MRYNLFISHSWGYGDQYERLKNLLNQQLFFEFYDYSVPQDDPIYNCPTDWQLEEAIERQIRPASCVIVIAGVYASYSKWIQKELNMAKRLGKKIIAVEPWGADRTSQIVKQAADEIVGWNTNSIVRAIRGY